MSELPVGLRIRQYEAADLDQVWSLHLEGVRLTRAEYQIAHGEYETDMHSIPETYLDGGNFWVVEDQEGLIAMAAIERIDKHTGRLRRMRVTEAWRRSGIARALLEVAEEFCRAQGCTRLILDTLAQQTEAQALYERSGFQRRGERTIGPFTVFDYEKELV